MQKTRWIVSAILTHKIYFLPVGQKNGVSAMLQICAAIPNADMAEIYPDFLDLAAIYTKKDHKMVNGRAILNDCPGLGIEINKFELTKLAADVQESSLLG